MTTDRDTTVRASLDPRAAPSTVPLPRAATPDPDLLARVLGGLRGLPGAVETTADTELDDAGHRPDAGADLPLPRRRRDPRGGS